MPEIRQNSTNGIYPGLLSVAGMNSNGTLLERLQKKGQDFKTQFHMFLHIFFSFESKIKLKKKFRQNFFLNIVSDFRKITEKETLETLKKCSKHVPKKEKFSTIFSGFRGLNHSSYQISEATFRQAIFLSFNFCFVHKTPEKPFQQFRSVFYSKRLVELLGNNQNQR